jgi:3'-phosphoadenosine 5'-phosphosulfate (PAPS) 3'-phosphatase
VTRKQDLPWNQATVWDGRLVSAIVAVEAAGAALMIMRGQPVAAKETGDQLKTAVDLAAEGWVLGYLRGLYPDDAFLAEEAFEAGTLPWSAPNAFWTVDALDGTRSFVEGYDGFCVQVAYVCEGTPVVAAIHEPTAGATFVAAHGAGAYRRVLGQAWCRLACKASPDWPKHPRFIDSTPPGGAVGALRQRLGGTFVECGSIGLKICRIAEDRADLFIKELRFKLWDVTPGDLVLREAGGKLGLWEGGTIPYGADAVYLRNLVAAPASLFQLAVGDLTSSSSV